MLLCIHSCWMSVDKGTIFGFVAPMLAIILVRKCTIQFKVKKISAPIDFTNMHTYTQINAVFMILALRTLWRVKRDQNKMQNESKFQASQNLGRLASVCYSSIIHIF